jgi:D-arginine dehydrogenase
MAMTAFDVVVVGGGVAGLSALAQLARAGLRVLLLEREPALAAHASGRNAAIYRPLEDDASTLALARRSLALLAELDAGPVLARIGVLLASADPGEVARLCARARALGIGCEPLDGAALPRAASSLAGGELAGGVLVPEGGVLDIDRLNAALAAAARAAGAELRVGAAVAALHSERGRVLGVVLPGGERIAAGAVVLAAGAWSARLGAACGAPLPLEPVRRHLVRLDLAAPLPAGHPVVWRLDDELYYRPEGAGVLASPCDAAAWPPCAPPSEPAALELLAAKLRRAAPALAAARVGESWACLRTFAPDRELCVGEDPRLAGLWWFAGLGGRGMAVAPAASELLAAALRGEASALGAALSPRRFAAD